MEAAPVPRSVLRHAVREAGRSNAPHFRMAAVLFKGRRVIAAGRNFHRKTSPASQTRYNAIHAEYNCLGKVNGKAQGLSLLVIRINREGKLRSSKPCPTCHLLLRLAGVSRVCYVDHEGSLVSAAL